MKKEKADKTYTIYNIRDYNTLLALLKEHKLELKAIKTSQITTNKGIREVANVIASGETAFLDFVAYLLKKQQMKTTKMLSKIKTEDFKFEYERE